MNCLRAKQTQFQTFPPLDSMYLNKACMYKIKTSKKDAKMTRQSKIFVQEFGPR